MKKVIGIVSCVLVLILVGFGMTTKANGNETVATIG